MTAPDRIWAGTYETFETCGDWDVYRKADSDTQYIRADLHEALQAENEHLKALVEDLKDEILEMGEPY